MSSMSYAVIEHVLKSASLLTSEFAFADEKITEKHQNVA